MKPDFKKIKENYNNYDGFVFYREIAGDTINPIMILSKLDNEYIFLLESANPDNKVLARYSFIGYDPDSVIIFSYSDEIKNSNDIFFEIKSNTEKKVFKENPGDFCGGYVGFLAYEAVNYMGVLRKKIRESEFPIFSFMKINRFFTYDNYTGRLYACCYLEKSNKDIYTIYKEAENILESMIESIFDKKDITKIYTSNVIDLREDLINSEYINIVKNVKQEIEKGEAIQVVISKKYELEFNSLNSLSVYRSLRNLNPSPYMFYLKFKEKIILGSSPETHLKIKDKIAYIKPIAGTYPITNKDLLEEQKKKLVSDPKEVSEHLMLLDLARNDLYTNCDIKSVKVEKSFSAEEYSHVIHLVSSVKGTLISHPFELFKKTFPAGTVSGAPKVRAIEIIDQYEKSPRQFYAGCVGYFSYNGDLDTCITIRSAMIENNKLTLRAGAGIVYDSIPEKEANEVENKLKAMFKAIERIKEMEEKNVFIS